MGLRGIEVLNNWAIIGGGISMLAVSILDINSSETAPTVFRNNTAAVGGGLLFEPGEAVHFELKVTTRGSMPLCDSIRVLDRILEFC